MRYLIICCLLISCDRSDKYQVGDNVCVYGVRGIISYPSRLGMYTVATVDSLGQIHRNRFYEREINISCK